MTKFHTGISFSTSSLEYACYVNASPERKSWLRLCSSQQSGIKKLKNACEYVFIVSKPLMKNVKRKGWFLCGWQVELCDPIVTHGPYLSSRDKGLTCITSVYFTFYSASALLGMQSAVLARGILSVRHVPALCRDE